MPLGFRAGALAAGIKPSGRPDLGVIAVTGESASVAATFTRNQVVADAPATKHVFGSNLCRIWVRVDPRTGRILALGVIDNLVKGAAGQAVQALNVLFGLPETTGLEQYPIAP